ncbi:alpha/beta hydrolase [Streptomyces spirodelae]|uniref:Alpha/beta hydrolase n=1 Tax=Streptomyces spirodelae TaxID=2812904 RepID=A0ABS3WUL9_9ACTN|nr:alpha/beta hydrolase [Streptomyces spirodelae]MBO8186794.1 alpha/beta hydrolase [Streptomyces spirodelae]
MTAPSPDLLRQLPAPHPDVAPLPPAVRLGGVRLLRGVPYAVPDGSRPLELDLWLPEGPAAAPAPVVLYVHGGAWRRGRRDDMGMRTRDWDPAPFARIAAAGFAVACVDYRLSGEARFPAPLDDLRGALRWLGQRAGELGVDPGRAVAWGESAGGHLAALLALTPGPAAPLAGGVVWYGPADLTTARGGFRPDDAATPEAALLGAAPAEAPALARAASPLHQVREGSPPFFLAHGERDTMVDRSHTEDLAAALRELGVRVELRLVPGADHGWYGAPDAEVSDLFAASLDFIQAL